MVAPRITNQALARCTALGNLSRPNRYNPKKVLSMKKASRASMASGMPKMSPTKREYSDQFMPN